MKPNDQVVRHHILKLPRKSREDCCLYIVTTDILLSTVSLLQPSNNGTVFAVMRLQIHVSFLFVFYYAFIFHLFSFIFSANLM